MSIFVWFCDECGYWRKEKSTGVHVTADPNDPRGRMLTHQLREAEYVPLTSNAEAGSLEDLFPLSETVA